MVSESNYIEALKDVEENRACIYRFRADVVNGISISNLNINAEESRVQEVFKNNTFNYSEFNFYYYKKYGNLNDLKLTEKLKVESNGDWSLDVGMFNSKYFKSREEFDNWLEWKDDDYEEKLGTILFEQALEHSCSEITVNILHYLNHKDEIEKDLDRIIDNESIINEIVYNIKKLQEESNGIKSEFESLDPFDKIDSKEYFDELLKEKMDEIREFEKVLSIYIDTKYNTDEFISTYINNSETKNDIENSLEKKLLYKHLCFLFGNNDDLDNGLEFKFEDFRILYSDGYHTVNTAKRGGYYISIMHVTS